MPDDERKQAEIDESARLLVDLGDVLQLLGCGSGWMTRFAARQGLHS